MSGEKEKNAGLLFTLRLSYCHIAYWLRYSVLLELTHTLYIFIY